MSGENATPIRQKGRRFVNWITHGYRPIAFIPYFLAATYWLAGGQTMTLVATIFPAAAVLLSLFTDRNAPPEHAPTGLRSLQSIDAWFQDHLQSGGATLAQTAVASLKIDNLENLEERLGIPMDDAILDEFANRVINTVRNGDVVVRGKKSDLLIFLTRVRAPESENLLHLSRRIQSCLDEPFHSGAARVYCTATIGIARANHVPDRSTSALIHAADVANRAAAKDGPGAVRIYKSSYGRTPNSDNALMGQVAAALENGQIIAWYQPQVSTHTGEISGFEALARWEHPTHGLISPASFLSMIDRLGLSQRLSEVILTHALSTLRAWDRAGLNIPSVSVNYSSDELSNPRLPEFLRWELDRFELAPDRLTVEVLENVIAESQEDIISRNLRAISDMGCRIDLDDFGTSYTSILNIRKFSVSRLKIDRQLVSRIDADEDQRKLVLALLAMSEQLGIETLAEGVETIDEHSMLAQLGCDHIQGFNLARPMPRGDSLAWIPEYRQSLPNDPPVGEKASEDRGPS